MAAGTRSERAHRDLRLSSPFAHGADVSHLQRSLNARLKARKQAVIAVDGEYGKATANAVRDVLWFLGAPSQWLDHGATVEAQEIIRRPNTRPDEWRATAKVRRKHVAAHTDAVDKLVAWVRAQDGKHEEGFSNGGPFVDHLERDFHMLRQPWCGAFAGWGLRHIAGVPVPDGIVYTPNILAWAHAQTNGFKIISKPVPGCLVLFKFPGVSHDTVDHVGVYLGAGQTGEGNTSADSKGSQNNGGSVAIKKRGGVNVVAYVGVKGLHF